MKCELEFKIIKVYNVIPKYRLLYYNKRGYNSTLLFNILYCTY